MTQDSTLPYRVIRQRDRRQQCDRRQARRPGGRRASDLDAFAISSGVAWPAGALEPWPDVACSGASDRITVH